MLLQWNRSSNKRLLPWKGEKDPYKIWLSEIILQQTRVEQGWDYYNRFVETFPNIEKLATAKDTRVFKLWEGLGYYTRCKNLIATAKTISKDLDGRFPDKYDDILALKGIGPYTAAAIASFAFNLPYAVVDGNVFRVLSRFFGISEPIDSAPGKKIFTALAGQLLDKKQPGTYNQALMDFGAVVCKPALPLCSECALKTNCRAYLNGMVEDLPVKEKKIVKKKRWIYYLLAEHNGKVYVRKRGSGDIWENLYEFIRIESEKQLTTAALNKLIPFEKGDAGAIDIKKISREYRQQLTHQTIHGKFFMIKLDSSIKLKGYQAVDFKRLEKLPFPGLINAYLSENSIG